MYNHSDEFGRLQLNTIDAIFQMLKPEEILSFLTSKHNLDKFLKERLDMIEPQKVDLGVSYKWVIQKSSSSLELKEFKDQAIMIPFLPSLRVLLMNDQVRSCVENPLVSDDGKLRSILDGSFYKNNEFFKANPNGLGKKK